MSMSIPNFFCLILFLISIGLVFRLLLPSLSEMESNFHDLPPLKRFRLMHHKQECSNPSHDISRSSLPAKKRKHNINSPPLQLPPISAAKSTICLPAKKRVCAVPSFDRNFDFEHQFDTQVFENDDEKSIGLDDSGKDGSSGGIVEDDGIACAICESTDGDPSDPIVLCDGCDLMVHSSCYGNPLTNGVPEGDWFCVQCLEAKSAESSSSKLSFSCCLCPNSGGALKPTTDGRWAHLVCAIFVPEVFFLDPESREGINCGKVVKRRWEQKCYLCKSNKGCVVDCSEPKCPLAFHVSCGLKEELSMEYRQAKRKGAVVAAFCRTHTDLWRKQEQTGKFKIVARDENKK